jgi:hypothetical protein
MRFVKIADEFGLFLVALANTCPGGEMVDAADLKSAAPYGVCQFESGPGHHPAHFIPKWAWKI